MKQFPCRFWRGILGGTGWFIGWVTGKDAKIDTDARIKKMKVKHLNQRDQAKWDAFVTIGVKLVTENRWKCYRRHQCRFIRFLDRLIKQYGDSPRLLASRADMMERDSAKLPYLMRAYRGAIGRRDRQEMVFSSHSIATIYLAGKRVTLADQWIKRLRRNLQKHKDRQWAKECSEMEKELKKMRTNGCGLAARRP